ncbi:GID complex subunit 4, VID24 [Coemansia sp. RSA 988]|nr:GID complex subunit 4, VID24 [Coemansia sp. RSA 988]
MPVITHRRVNEMRSGRRRLSAGVIGGSGSPRAAGPGLVFRHGPLFRSLVDSKDHPEGKSVVLERRASTRSVGAPEAGVEDVPSSSSSMPASPELFFVQASRLNTSCRQLTTASGSSVQREERANTTTNGGRPQIVAVANYNTSASATDSTHTDAVSTEPLGCIVENAACANVSTWGMFSDTGEDGNAFATMPKGELEQLPDSSFLYYSTGEEFGEDELHSEPLPTPEQLIFSQVWNTWPTPCHDLYSGSRFSGTQSNGVRSYIVTVALQYVDMGVPELCGHFTICGLTNELPKLTTYFDAQIVGTGGHTFITNKWDASVDTDRTHWSFFSCFQPYKSRFDSECFEYRLTPTDRYIFMRWKERFVVPNYRLNRINGASYEGFYYVCYDRVESSITGFYYHKESEHYQRLDLSHSKQASFSHFEIA